jgi:uncharacterized protein YdeI (YjbR/CyaY-like superfamily)
MVKSFSALLERMTAKNLNWTIVWIPFDVAKSWGTRGHIRIKGEINGFEFRTALLPTRSGRHFMIVNKQMQKGAKVRAGMKVHFRMEADSEKRVAPAVPEMEKVFRSSRALRKFYESLSPSMQTDIARFVAAAKQPETRVRRAERMAERLMETMEAERDLPPMIRQVFAREPKAFESWSRMSPSHRRRHLLSIFYYQDHLARLRRIELTVEEMLRRTDDSRE